MLYGKNLINKIGNQHPILPTITGNTSKSSLTPKKTNYLKNKT